MSPNGISPGFDKIFIISSSESSDSESLLREDIKGNGNDFNKQWEAIERTLYQEPGQHVTDSELLKECKLWRETFPHFRVKGTKMDIKPTSNRPEENERSIQTLEQHFNFKKLEEKRGSIKSKVVGMLVDRLITKYSPGKESANSAGNLKSVAQITEIDDDSVEEFLKAPLTKPTNRNRERLSGFSTDKESYFERGKAGKEIALPKQETVLQTYKQKTKEQEEKNMYDSWERDIKTALELSKPFQTPQNFPKSPLEKPKNTERYKLKKTPPSSALGDAAKPFELTKKIDKKYEGLVYKIFDRKYNDLETIRHCRTSASGLEMKSLQESLEKLRIGSGIDDYMKRNTMPRISKFDNNWLKRGEINLFGDSPPKITQSMKSSNQSKSNLYNSNSEQELDEKFLENLRRDVTLNYKRPPKRSGVIEKVSCRRPRPFVPTADKQPKTLNGDMKRKSKQTNSQKPKTEVKSSKSEPNYQKGLKHSSTKNKGGKSNGNQNQRLPPIETGIICTELAGRPKIGPRNPPKRY